MVAQRSQIEFLKDQLDEKARDIGKQQQMNGILLCACFRPEVNRLVKRVSRCAAETSAPPSTAADRSLHDRTSQDLLTRGVMTPLDFLGPLDARCQDTDDLLAMGCRGAKSAPPNVGID